MRRRSFRGSHARADGRAGRPARCSAVGPVRDRRYAHVQDDPQGTDRWRSRTFVGDGTQYPVAVDEGRRRDVKSSPGGIACGVGLRRAVPGGHGRRSRRPPERGGYSSAGAGRARARRRRVRLEMTGPKGLSAAFGRVADPIAPRVTALVSTADPAAIAHLRYRVIEASGRSKEVARCSGTESDRDGRGTEHAVDGRPLLLPALAGEPGGRRRAAFASASRRQIKPATAQAELRPIAHHMNKETTMRPNHHCSLRGRGPARPRCRSMR